ncbi:MAG TPA: response regulator [Thiotrichaceae bacterium]|nr:response regulator [Thiotrichaceae bacterium]
MDTLLVIDDTPDNLKLLLNYLSQQGFKVLVAQDGENGIEMAKLTRPDLILLDVMMPDMDGFEVCQFLKSKPEIKDIPIIFMTALIDTIDKLKGFELGAADYITKPFQNEEVLARIRAHLNVHKLQRQLTQQKQQLIQEINRCQQAELEREEALEALQVEKVSLAKRVEERTIELTRTLRLKDEFLANMSHELRTPLTAILGISEGFIEQFYGPLNDKQQKFMQTLAESGRHLLALINDILDFAKLEAEKFTLNLDSVSVNKVCQASLRMIKEAADKKRLGVFMTFDGMVNTIQADERRLKQILVNLLSNAIKFTPNGGSIELEVRNHAEKGMLDFSVKDTGIGIAQEDIKYLFAPFVQLDGGLNRASEGTGLGLSLVYHLTKMHNGIVSVESEIGKGSCFTVSLPWES